MGDTWKHGCLNDKADSLLNSKGKVLTWSFRFLRTLNSCQVCATRSEDEIEHLPLNDDLLEREGICEPEGNAEMLENPEEYMLYNSYEYGLVDIPDGTKLLPGTCEHQGLENIWADSGERGSCQSYMKDRQTVQGDKRTCQIFGMEQQCDDHQDIREGADGRVWKEANEMDLSCRGRGEGRPRRGGNGSELGSKGGMTGRLVQEARER